MKRLIQKIADNSSIKLWDGSKRMLSRTTRFTKGIFTDANELYVWKDYNLHHATAQESIGIEDCAHILIEMATQTIMIEYPRGAHSMNQEYMLTSNNPTGWFDYYQNNSSELFARDVSDIQSLFSGWTVNYRQFNQTAQNNRLKKITL